MTTYEKYEAWLANPYFDESIKDELRGIAGQEREIEERFYQDLKFGTAGLRGIMGAVTNRMNVYTVRKATQGLANYILKNNGQERGVAIACDSRHMSREFCEEAALCLAANGIKAYVFDSLRPTPELSYAVRKLGCISGINVTASHNPPEYNGYKVYWEDGAQITPPHDTGIMAEVDAVSDFSRVKMISKGDAVSQGLYITIGKEIDDCYIEELKKNVIHPQCVKEAGSKIKIVYTPLHGAGNLLVRRLLRELGFENVYVVAEQEMPNGDFPTVSYPNPEDPKAFTLALALAKEKDADLVLATDPDSDRIGVFVKDTKSGEYIRLNGNVMGCLLTEYELGQRLEAQGKLPEDGKVVRSIVTSRMVDAIAGNYGVGVVPCLTGFKWIGKAILQMEQSGGTYLFGFEESFGYLVGTHARDKDAVVSAMAFCEAAAYYYQRNMTLWDAILAMYEKYGYFEDTVISITHKGKEGLDLIQNIMIELRKNPPKEIGEYHAEKFLDYSKGIDEIPVSNVLQFNLGKGVWLAIRPSGTEPKIKLYFGVIGKNMADARQKSSELERAVTELLERVSN